MRNILIQSPSCNWHFACIAIDAPIVIAHLHSSSASHIWFTQPSHHLITSCPHHMPLHLRVTDATFENLTTTTT